MKRSESIEQQLAKLFKKRAWGLQGNMLPFSLQELDRQIAELNAQRPQTES